MNWQLWRRRPSSQRDAPEPTGSVGPDAVEVGARMLRVGDRVCRTVAVTGYPREVTAGWLQPLLAHPATLDVAVHVEPIPPQVAADRLRRQRARLESTRRIEADSERLADPNIEVAATDAADLHGRLARGEARLFRVGIYVTVWAADPDALDAAVERVRGLLAALLLDVHATTYRTLQGWATTRPFAIDAIGLRRTFDTDALAAAYPFTPTTPDSNGGSSVVYGVNPAGRGVVVHDRFGQDNYNAVILARSGAGKSYLAKLEALRSLYHGVDVAVVDPEDEYRRLATAVAGTHVPLGTGDVRINPFDLPAGQPDALVRRGLFIHTLLAVLLRKPLDADETATVDRAIIAAYAAVGITSDPRSHTRPAPVLADLARVLADDDPAGGRLTGRLAPYVTGSHRRLFDGPTTHHPDGHLVVFSLRELPDEVKPVGTLLALDAIWQRLTNGTAKRRRMVVVDEAWQLMADPAGARFLARLAKSARKHWTGLTVVTQDAADLLATDLGQAIVANAATQILLRQAPQAIDRLAGAFRLSDGEQQLLLTADRGHGVLAAGTTRTAFHATASSAEHRLITTDPADRNDRNDDSAAGQ